MCNATDLGRVQNIAVKYAEYLCVTDTPFLVNPYRTNVENRVSS